MSEAAVVQTTQTPAANTTVVETKTAAHTTEWTSALNEDLKGYVSNKGFKDPAMVVEGYRNLEKLRGVPAERLLTIPERYDDQEGWKGVYNRLGRPEKPEGYKMLTPEQGGNPEFIKAASSMFHDAGLTVQQGEVLAGKWNNYINETTKAQDAVYQAKLSEQDATLKKEWGMAFEENVGQAKKAAQAFGLKAEDIDAMEKALGLAPTMKFFHSIGVKMGEAEFITGGKGGAKTMTPEGAKSKISELMNDKHFFKRLTDGEVSAKEEWDKLHSFAYAADGG